MKEAEAIYSRAAKAELAGDYNKAYGLYISAAETFLHKSRSPTSTEKLKTQCRAQASKSLERAEKIRTFTEKSVNRVSELTPVNIDYFSEREQAYILQKGNMINGRTYSAWNVSSAASQKDDDQPALSPAQMAVSPVWRSAQGPLVSAAPLLPQDIMQYIVNDCSVSASLSVCLEHSRRFQSKLTDQILHPDPKVPGKYRLKIFINGEWRQINIDDKLPCHPTNGNLVCMSCTPADEGGVRVIWPSLIEKGFMKLMGGYDFPGSNTSIDLHALIGWIPEQIEIRSADFEAETSWRRLSEGFHQGRCLITLGTGDNDDTYYKDIFLLPLHSYAVIDVSRNVDDERYVTIVDSWLFSAPLQASVASSRELKIPWAEALVVFHGIYLSWNPDIWNTHLNFHGMWKFKNAWNGKARPLRLRFSRKSVDTNQEIWILLARHVINTKDSTAFISLNAHHEEDSNDNTQIHKYQKIETQGNYTNSTHILLRTRLLRSQRTGIVSLLASLDGSETDTGFTISAYGSDVELSWDKNIAALPYQRHIDGFLTNKNAGGHALHPTFMLNPQYHLKIRQSSASASRKSKADIGILLQAGKELPVNITILWSHGERILDLSQKEVSASSGAYSHGNATVQCTIPDGDYTVIVSAFEPKHTGKFELDLSSSLPFDINPIPQEGAGLYSKIFRGSWTKDSAGGSPSSGTYSENPVFEIDLTEPSRLSMRLQLLRPSASIALNVTLFAAGNLEDTLATSGGYDDAVCGVLTPEISLKASKYWIIPSTFKIGVVSDFRIIVYSSSSLSRVS